MATRWTTRSTPAPAPTALASKELVIASMPSVAPECRPQFPLFPFLPMELRLKIWGILISTPPAMLLAISPALIKHPITLHICRESRSEALKKYTLLKTKIGGSLRRLYGFYIRYDKDVLLLNTSMDLYKTARYRWKRPTWFCGASCLYRDWLVDARSIAVSMVVIDNVLKYGTLSRVWQSLSEICPKLEELNILVDMIDSHDYCFDWDRHVKLKVGRIDDLTMSRADHKLAEDDEILAWSLSEAQDQKGICKGLQIRWMHELEIQ